MSGELERPEATVRRTADQPVISSPVMTTVLTAPGSVTDGEYGLFEVRLPPDSPGATPQWHEGFTETFYVLTGRLALLTGDRWITVDAGDLVRVPPRSIHAFRPDSAAEVRFLLLFTPAGQPREEYFAAMAELAARDVPPTEAEIDAVARRHDQFNVRG